MNKKANKAAKKAKKAARAAIEDRDTEQQGEIPNAQGEIHADVGALKKDIKKPGSKRFLFVALAAVLVVAGTIFVWHLISAASNGLQYVTQPAAFTDITASVTETGIVNAINQVSIGSEVSGTIKSIRVDFNSTVKAGQILATLDPTTYQAAENSAQASLELARASLNSAKRTSKKMMDLVDMANLTLQRDKGLNNKGLVDGNQVDLDRTAAETAQQDYLVAQAQIQVATSQVNVSFGQLQQSQFSLSKTIIVSPYDGIIILRNVSIGQTVAASLQTPTLFMLATSTLPITATSGANVPPADSSALSAPPPASTSSQSPVSLAVSLSPVSLHVIASTATTGASTALATSILPSAGGLTDMQVDTSVDEADVGTVKDGETAQISVPAFPNVIFPGTVLQVRINPTIVQNVVTYDAVVTVHDTTGRLFPGMTAQVDIVTATSAHVLSVPVSAVLYRPLAGKAGNAARASVTSSAGVAQIGKATSPGIAVAGAPGSKVTVWVLRGGKPVAVKVVIGLSDSKNMEVISGALAEGDPLITAEGNDRTP